MNPKPGIWCPGFNADLDIANGCVGCWPLWSGSGIRAMDVANSAVYGTLTNGPTWVPGGINLDRTSNEVIAVSPGRSLLLGGWGPYTIIWTGLLPKRAIAVDSIVGIGDTSLSTRANMISQSSTQDWRFGFSAFSNVSAFVTSGIDNGLITFALVYESNTSRKLYLNGSLFITDTDSVTPSGTPNILTVGCTPRGTFTSGNSNQDCYAFGLYSRALSPSEIAEPYADPNVLIRPPKKEYFWVAASSGGAAATPTVGILRRGSLPGMLARAG